MRTQAEREIELRALTRSIREATRHEWEDYDQKFIPDTDGIVKLENARRGIESIFAGDKKERER